MDLVQRVRLRELPQRGHGAQLRQHVGPQVVGDQLVTLEVGAVHPDLCQQPIRACVGGQEDGVLRTGSLLQLKEGNHRLTNCINASLQDKCCT